MLIKLLKKHVALKKKRLKIIETLLNVDLELMETELQIKHFVDDQEEEILPRSELAFNLN